MCLLAAITGVIFRGLDNNVLVQIGFVVLVGLAAKNAILIVEFAKQGEDGGLDRVQAAVQAARTRLRPILMTSLARSEEHTSELQSQMRLSYAAFCFKKKKKN